MVPCEMSVPPNPCLGVLTLRSAKQSVSFCILTIFIYRFYPQGFLKVALRIFLTPCSAKFVPQATLCLELVSPGWRDPLGLSFPLFRCLT